MKTLKAKPFDQNAENWNRENWPFTTTVLAAPAARGKIELVRTHSEVIEQFDSFSLFKLLILVRNRHCWSRKALPRQMTPWSREKNSEDGPFRLRWQAWKVVRSIAAVRQRPKTPRNWRCSFAFFESFLWHFNEKQRAEVFFRLSRPNSCKNQEMALGSNDLSTFPFGLATFRQTLTRNFFAPAFRHTFLLCGASTSVGSKVVGKV